MPRTCGAQHLPRSLLHLDAHVTEELVSELLATRSERELQSLSLGMIDEPGLAALVAELVSTDPSKQWTLDASFDDDDAADAFCDGVIAAARSCTGLPSLTDLDVETTVEGRSAFAKLLAATPTFSTFFVRLSEVCGSEWVRVVNRCVDREMCVGRVSFRGV